jgi:hypothetical protein
MIAMGSNKTFQQKGDKGRVLGESDEFRRLRHAVEKAAGDRERAIRNVCRLYGVNRLDALPPGIRTTALALLDHLKGGSFVASLEALVKE